VPRCKRLRPGRLPPARNGMSLTLTEPRSGRAAYVWNSAELRDFRIRISAQSSLQWGLQRTATTFTLDGYRKTGAAVDSTTYCDHGLMRCFQTAAFTVPGPRHVIGNSTHGPYTGTGTWLCKLCMGIFNGRQYLLTGKNGQGPYFESGPGLGGENYNVPDALLKKNGLRFAQ